MCSDCSGGGVLVRCHVSCCLPLVGVLVTGTLWGGVWGEVL